MDACSFGSKVKRKKRKYKQKKIKTHNESWRQNADKLRVPTAIGSGSGNVDEDCVLQLEGLLS